MKTRRTSTVLLKSAASYGLEDRRTTASSTTPERDHICGDVFRLFDGRREWSGRDGSGGRGAKGRTPQTLDRTGGSTGSGGLCQRSINGAMNCEICGKKAVSIKKVTKSFGRGHSLVVIEDIPVLSCSSCHESYVTADTAREIDRIRKNRIAVGKAKRVLVASFTESAA